MNALLHHQKKIYQTKQTTVKQSNVNERMNMTNLRKSCEVIV